MNVFIFIVVLCLLKLTIVSAAEVEGAGKELPSTAEESIVCICKCCYLGECSALANGFWHVKSCQECTARQCRDFVESSGTRARISRTFKALEPKLPEGPGLDLQIDLCEVVSVLETATCTGSGCRRITNLKAECFDRNESLHKYIIVMFVSLSTIGVIFGFVKNHLPALQDFNMKYFNY
eukprot:Tbor_TRINITY_DN4626_c0_g1::TRINITY_DN4626_c0_g1_i1::g.14800::m.14800